jgi:putative transposase
VSGLARTRLATSVADAGWLILAGLLQQKEPGCHRTVAGVGGWFPSSRLCSGCGVSCGEKPLAVRSWTCTQCGITADRDLNAARNTLVEPRMVAAGPAQTLDARGGGVRAGPVPAAACGSQNPPRCRACGTVGIPVTHGREDVKYCMLRPVELS